MLRQSQEEDWSRVIGEHCNDPWERVYQICKVKGSHDVAGIKMNVSEVYVDIMFVPC